MDTLAFTAVIGCLVIVALWYAANEATGSAGEKGLLAFAPEEKVAPKETYGAKARGGLAGSSFVTAKRGRRYGAKDDPAFRATRPRPRFVNRLRKD
jgi:hypothetical protein